MSRMTYFRALVTSPSRENATLRPHHLPAWAAESAQSNSPETARAAALDSTSLPNTGVGIIANGHALQINQNQVGRSHSARNDSETDIVKSALHMSATEVLSRVLVAKAADSSQSESLETSGEPRVQTDESNAQMIQISQKVAHVPELAPRSNRHSESDSPDQVEHDTSSSSAAPLLPATADHESSRVSPSWTWAIPEGNPRQATETGHDRRSHPEANTPVFSPLQTPESDTTRSGQRLGSRNDPHETGASALRGHLNRLMPAVAIKKNPPPQPVVKAKQNTIHIGTIDIHIAPPPAPANALPPRIVKAPVTPLAREFTSSLGLRQG